MFIRKHWLLLSVLIVVICAVSFYFLLPDVPDEPIKIYKFVEPLEKPTQDGHFHEDGSWHAETDTIEPTNRNAEDDWRDNSTVDSTVPKNDPWKQTTPVNVSADAKDDTHADAKDDTYPPRDWHKTEDPELYATYFYAQLLKQFGDIPEAHIIGEHRLNKVKGIPTTLGTYEIYLEAMYSLFPNEENKQTLDRLQELKTSDSTIYFK